MGQSLETDIAIYWSRWAPLWDMLRLVSLNRKYRQESVSVLELSKGMTVLDIACGTGFNFPYLVEAVGERGRIVAIDIAPGMLKRAKKRVRKNGWQNFEFIQGDVSRIQLPNANAATAFWCMVSIPEHRRALENIASSLVSDGKLAVLDFKPIEGFLGPLLNPISRWLFRFTHQDINRKPWRDMEALLANVQLRERRVGGLLSSVYLAWGQKK